MLYVTHSPAEAIALGSRLFLLERGRIVAEGPPLDVLASRAMRTIGSITWKACATSSPPASWTTPRARTRPTLRLDDGPELIVGSSTGPPAARLLVEIRADDILLARQPSPACQPATRSRARSSGSSPTAPRPRPWSAPAADLDRQPRRRRPSRSSSWSRDRTST